MKEYKLVSLPELNSSFDKVVFRRMLSDLSHRHLTFVELVKESGLRRQEVRTFLDMLQGHGLLEERECSRDFSPTEGLLETFRQTPDWLRRAFSITA